MFTSCAANVRFQTTNYVIFGLLGIGKRLSPVLEISGFENVTKFSVKTHRHDSTVGVSGRTGPAMRAFNCESNSSKYDMFQEF